MSAPSLENQFTQYWSKLSIAEKKSLVIVAGNYVHSREENGSVSIEQYNDEIDEAMMLMDAGEFYTHEEVVEPSKTWLNGKQNDQMK
jgi:predicted transcriptional regulator